MLESRIELHNGNYLEMYGSIEDLPAENLGEYNRYVVIDSGIGSDQDAVNSHVFNIARYIQKEDKENAIKCLDHLLQCFTFVMDRKSPEAMSFYCLVKSINGQRVPEDLSEDWILQQMKVISRKGLTIGKLRGYLDHFKKKTNRNWKSSFRGPLTSVPPKKWQSV